jgi:hypothetical protein
VSGGRAVLRCSHRRRWIPSTVFRFSNLRVRYLSGYKRKHYHPPNHTCNAYSRVHHLCTLSHHSRLQTCKPHFNNHGYQTSHTTIKYVSLNWDNRLSRASRGSRAIVCADHWGHRGIQAHIKFIRNLITCVTIIS